MRYILDTSSLYIKQEMKMIHIAEKSINRFLKKSGNEYDDYINVIATTPFVICTNEHLTKSYALAHIVGSPTHIKELHITLTHKIGTYGKPLIYEIISHEVAHCIDFLVRGNSFHDDEWRKIHRLMGGTGETLIQYRGVAQRQADA